MTTTGCEERVWHGYRSTPCRFKAKHDVDGRMLCGVHKRAIDVRRENQEALKREDEARRARRDKADGIVARLAAVGVTAAKEYRVGTGPQMGTHTGNVVLTPEEVDALIERLT